MNIAVKASSKTHRKVQKIITKVFGVELEKTSYPSKDTREMLEAIKEKLTESDIEKLNKIAEDYFDLGLRRGLKKGALLTRKRTWQARKEKLSYSKNIKMKVTLELPDKQQYEWQYNDLIDFCDIKATKDE